MRPTLYPIFDIENLDVYAFEISKIPSLHRNIRFEPLPDLPGTRRELNFISPEGIPVALLLELVRSSHEWVSEVGVSEIYRDEQHIGADKKSVVISFLIRNPLSTITDTEALQIQETVIQNLAHAGYPLRGV